MKKLISTFIFCFAISFNYTVFAAAHQTQLQDQAHQQISNSHLLTQQERNEYQNRIRKATSAEEKQQIRNEYQKLIKTRAKEQGAKSSEKSPRYKDGGFGSGRGLGGGSGRGR